MKHNVAKMRFYFIASALKVAFEFVWLLKPKKYYTVVISHVKTTVLSTTSMNQSKTYTDEFHNNIVKGGRPQRVSSYTRTLSKVKYSS